MTKEEKALDYLNQFKACKFQDLGKPFTGQDSGMGFILVYMYHNVKEVTQKELAEKMNVSKARITSLVQKMIEKGLVTRKTSNRSSFSNHFTFSETMWTFV